MRLPNPLCLLFALAVIPAWVPACWGQTSGPPLRVLVAVPAGGTSDAVARILAPALRTGLGRPVVVENKPGATGRIAVETLRNASPDGATLLLAPIAIPVLVPLVFRNAGYDPVRDLAPVGEVARYEVALAVSGEHSARTLAEFVAWVRTDPSMRTYGSPGAGSLGHYLGAMFDRMSGVALVHVPYQGVSQLVTELMGRQIAAGISVLPDLIALHQAGRIRVLATAGGQRSRFTPLVPTFLEQGWPGLEMAGWLGMFAPADATRAERERLSQAIAAALALPDIRDRLTGLALDVTGTTPDALAATVSADIARWRQIVKASGFSAD
ncbi:MAG: tripartite tricarboxylate transporter substrate-binding protein [Burkholderiales bacterium]